MAKIHINNPKQVINGGAKKYYFKVKGLGGPKGDKGDKGDTGATGPQGPQGNAATVSVGSTTTLPVGQDATVENVGTLYNAVLNFGIPQGPRGPQGATGATGAKGDKGDQGNPGPQGERGTNATVYIGTTSTLAPGSQATVYNSGTENNAVLNFGIPKGEKGDTGPMPTIAQTTGSSTTSVMSQKATTDALNTKQATLSAGTGINIASNTVSADTTVLATQTDIAPKLETEIVSTLPATGDENKLYLTPKNYTTGTASGNPIAITLGEDEGAIDSFELDGDTYQQTYTGKNLYDASLAENGNILSDGTIDSSSLYVHSALIPVTPSTDYTASAVFSGTENDKYIRMAFYDSQQTFISRTTASGVNTTTAPATASYCRIAVAVTSTSVMLEKSSTATSYEPYTGGQPSPNPSYPQAIQTVTGEQTVEIVGKNLFDKASAIIGKVLSANGTLENSGNDYYTSDFIPVKPNTNYYKTFSLSVRFKYYGADKVALSTSSYQDIANAANAQSFTTPSGAYYVRLSLGAAYLNTLQIELGSTATAYTPYSKQTLPINLGKNLISASWESGGYNNLTGDKVSYSDSVRTDAPIAVLPNTTYICSRNGSGVAMNVFQYKADGSFISAATINSGNSFTTGANTYLITMFRGTSGGTEGIQLELGSTITPYAPYFTPIELCKLSTYQDYIWKDGDSWKVHKAIEKRIFNGSETWTKNSNNHRTGFDPRTLVDSTVASVAISDNFIYWPNTTGSIGLSLPNNQYGLPTNRENIDFRYDTIPPDYDGDTAWKAYLAEHNITLYTAKTAAFVTDTIITNATLIAQLEAVLQAKLQASNTITNTANGSNLAGDMELDYHEYDPTNRYNKWLWLDINENYEKLGS